VGLSNGSITLAFCGPGDPVGMLPGVPRSGVRRPQRKPSPLGENVRQRRVALGLTQPQVAERAGLSTNHVNMIEHGERQGVRPKTLRGLAEALECTVEELLAGSADVTPARRAMEEFITEERLGREEATAMREYQQKLGPPPSERVFWRLLDLVREEQRTKRPRS
jgi:transcriptional regulator with XRE-family HTH domain